MKTQISHHAKNISFKTSSKRNQNPSSYYNSITNLRFQHKPKYHLPKIFIEKQTYQIEAKIRQAAILYNESKHNILALVGKSNKNFKSRCSTYTCQSLRLACAMTLWETIYELCFPVAVIKGEKVGQIDIIYVRGKFRQSTLGKILTGLNFLC